MTNVSNRVNVGRGLKSNIGINKTSLSMDINELTSVVNEATCTLGGGGVLPCLSTLAMHRLKGNGIEPI